MRFKKQIIILCLFTFLFLPYQKPKANEGVMVASGLVSGGLATVNAPLVVPVLLGLAIGCGLSYIGYNLHQMATDFCNDYQEKYGVSVFDVVMGKAIDGKYAVTSQLVDDFIDYANKYACPGEVYLSVTEEHLGSVLTVPVGGSFAWQGYNDYYRVTTNATKQFDVLLKDSGGGVNVVVDGVPSDSIYGLSPGNVQIWWTPMPISDTLTTPIIDGIPYAEEQGDLILDIPTDLMEKDLYTDMPVDDVGVQSGILTPDGQVEQNDKDGVIEYPIPDTDIVGETPTTGDSLWDTLLGWLGTLFKPVINLLKGLWELLKGLFDLLKDLLTSILDLLKSLVKSLVDAIAGLFVPTLALEDVFNLNQNTFFGQVAEVFNFDKLWNLTPKPYEFEVDFPFYDFAEQEERPYHLEIKFFKNKFMKENINLIRNITTYPLLLISIYFVIMHFLPKRDMD